MKRLWEEVRAPPATNEPEVKAELVGMTFEKHAEELSMGIRSTFRARLASASSLNRSAHRLQFESIAGSREPGFPTAGSVC